MNRPSPFWRTFWITAGVLTVLLSAALIADYRDTTNPPRPMKVVPAQAK